MATPRFVYTDRDTVRFTDTDTRIRYTLRYRTADDGFPVVTSVDARPTN